MCVCVIGSWDYDSGKLNKDLKYQSEDDFMMHDGSVLALSFSRDSEYIASGSNKGEIKVWKIRTGQCVKRFEGAHTGAVTSVEFGKDGTQLVSGSMDQTVRIHGLKSGKTLKEFRGHKSFVNAAVYSEDQTKIISASSDGSIKVWDSKSSDCLKSFNPASASISVIGLTRMPSHSDRLLATNRSNTLRVMTLDGSSIQSLVTAAGDVVTSTVSPKGRFVYAVSDDGVLHAWDTDSGKLEISFKVRRVVSCLHGSHSLACINDVMCCGVVWCGVMYCAVARERSDVARTPPAPQYHRQLRPRRNTKTMETVTRVHHMHHHTIQRRSITTNHWTL